MCGSPVAVRKPSLVSSIPYGSFASSLSPEGRDLMETSHLGLSVPRSLTLHKVQLQGEASVQGTDLFPLNSL